MVITNSSMTFLKKSKSGSAYIAIAGVGVGKGNFFASFIITFVRGPIHKK